MVAIANVVLAIALLLEAHWVGWFFWDLGLGSEKGLYEAATGGIAGGVIALLPEASRAALKEAAARVTGSRRTTGFLAAASVSCLSVACAVGRLDVLLPAGSWVVVVDGIPRSPIESNAPVSLKAFRLAFTSVEVGVGDLRMRSSATPVVPASITLTENLLNTTVPLYREAQEDLLSAFFQYMERDFLDAADRAFKADEGKFKELSRIHDILTRCFIEADLSQRGDVAIETYEQAYPSSVWVPLLRSCIAYSRREYAAARDQLEFLSGDVLPEFRATYLFFRGVNRLRAHIASRAAGGSASEKPDLLADFQASGMVGLGTGAFSELVKQSSAIFRGITLVYLGRMDEALSQFEAACSGRNGGLRSRAFNDVGFVRLISGDLGSAKQAFYRASDEGVETFPTARINLAYVEMSLGEYGAARAILQAAVADPVLKRLSFSSFLLAEAGLAHLALLTGSEDPVSYDQLLADMKLPKFEGETNALARLAHIHHSLASHLYLSKDYYGLEIFAMAMEAYCIVESDRVMQKNASSDLGPLRQEALASFERIRATVSPSWFVKRNASGVFGAIFSVLDRGDTDEERPASSSAVK